MLKIILLQCFIKMSEKMFFVILQQKLYNLN